MTVQWVYRITYVFSSLMSGSHNLTSAVSVAMLRRSMPAYFSGSHMRYSSCHFYTSDHTATVASLGGGCGGPSRVSPTLVTPPHCHVRNLRILHVGNGTVNDRLIGTLLALLSTLFLLINYIVFFTLNDRRGLSLISISYLHISPNET